MNNLPEEGWYINVMGLINKGNDYKYWKLLDYLRPLKGRDAHYYDYKDYKYCYYGVDGDGWRFSSDQEWVKEYQELTIDEFLQLKKTRVGAYADAFELKWTDEQVCDLIDELLPFDEDNFISCSLHGVSNDYVRRFKLKKGLIKQEKKRLAELNDIPQTELERRVNEMYEYFTKHCKK